MNTETVIQIVVIFVSFYTPTAINKSHAQIKERKKDVTGGCPKPVTGPSNHVMWPDDGLPVCLLTYEATYACTHCA